MQLAYDRYNSLIRGRIGEFGRGPMSFTILLQNLRGLHPVELRSLLELNDSTWLHCLLELEPRGADGGTSKHAANPLLSEWYFTEETSRRLGNLVDLDGKDVGLIGISSLLRPIVETGNARSVVLLDIDPPLDMTGKFQAHVERVDLWKVDVSKYHGSFDIIFFDPPWYLSEYLYWVQLAFYWSRTNGIVIGSLFPELVRPAAEAERSQIVSFVSAISEGVSLIQDFLLYETPSFEAGQLREVGLPTGAWKKADTLTAFVKSRERPVTPVRQALADWEEVTLGARRLFVRSGDFDEGQFLARPASGSRSVLASPSRRSEGMKRANVLSSDGHGLIVAQPRALLLALSSAASGDMTPLEAIYANSDGFSRRMLDEIVPGRLRSNDD